VFETFGTPKRNGACRCLLWQDPGRNRTPASPLCGTLRSQRVSRRNGGRAARGTQRDVSRVKNVDVAGVKHASEEVYPSMPCFFINRHMVVRLT